MSLQKTLLKQFLAVLALAGSTAPLMAQSQALRITNQQTQWPQPTYAGGTSGSTPFRAEFFMFNPGTGPAGIPVLMDTGGVPFSMRWNGGTGLWLGPSTRTIGTPCTLTPGSYSGGVAVRYQYDPNAAGGAGFGQESCEFFDYAAGTSTLSQQFYTATLVNGLVTGNLYGNTNGEFSIGFLRLYSTLVPTGGKPPLPSDPPGDLVSFTFNGTLNDGSGNGRNMSMVSGSAVYVANPPAVVRTSVKTYDAPAWGSIPCRASAACRLDGRDSYTTAEGSGQLFYLWAPTGGPVEWRLDDNKSSAPSMTTPPVFGEYQGLLSLRDDQNNQVSSVFKFQAVGMDDQGVVVPKDPRVTQLYGPMIARGRNPWSYADKVAKDLMLTARNNYTSISPPPWREWKAGTVAYKGYGNQQTITNSPGTTGTTIVFTSTVGLDTTTPTVVATGGFFTTSAEWIRICSFVGTTATVCPGGRGWGGTAPQNLTAGNTLYQTQVTGTGTQFLTEMCPNGAGRSGTTFYNTGTVAVTNGSNQITGTGTGWTSTVQSRVIQINGLVGAVPFVWQGIATFVNATRIDVVDATGAARPWPGDNGSGLSYTVLNYDRGWALEWSNPNIPTGGVSPLVSSAMTYGSENVAVCESNTRAYFLGLYEFQAALNESGRRYTYLSSNWVSNNVGQVNYYDEVLGEYGEYLASADEDALETARMLSDYWGWNPQTAGGYSGTAPRQMSWTGVIASALVDPATPANVSGSIGPGHQYNLGVTRSMLTLNANPLTVGCNADLRETAYLFAFNAAEAIVDPDPVRQAVYRAYIDNAYTRDNSCKGPYPYGNPQTYYREYEISGLTLTNGSATVTGSGIPSTYPCTATGEGTASFTNGSATVNRLSGTTFPAFGSYIVIIGARATGPYVLSYTQVSGDQITLGNGNGGPGLWSFASGTYSYHLIPNTPFEEQLVFRNTLLVPENDPNLDQTYSCVWNNAGQITLDRPWQGSTISTGAGGRFNLLGRGGAQPFMNGIKGAQMSFSVNAGATSSPSYVSLLAGTADWLSTTGYRASEQSSWYGAGWPMCTPQLEAAPNINCASDLYAARILNTEAFLPLAQDYLASPNPTKAAFLNNFYGAVWGKPGWQPGGYFTGATDAWTGGGVTFTGFRTFIGNAIGFGFPRAIPAVLAGISPEQLRTVTVAGDLRTSTSMRVTLIYPNGKQVSNTCAASVCTVNADVRLGSRVLQLVEYLTGGTVNRRTGLSSVTIN